MRNRNILKMILLTIVTFGIYFLYWYVSTAREMRKQGADIPNAILIIIPIVNIWWTWKYSKGVEHVTGTKLSAVLAFVLLYAVGFIGIYIVQDSFNNASAQVPASGGAAPASTGGQAQVPAGHPVDPAAPTTVAAGVGVVASEANDPLPTAPDQPSGQSTPKPVETPPQPETVGGAEETIDEGSLTAEGGNTEEKTASASSTSLEEPQTTETPSSQEPAGEEPEKKNDSSGGSDQSQSIGSSL